MECPDIQRAFCDEGEQLQAWIVIETPTRSARGQRSDDATQQEVVFLAVSRTNGCSYCTAAHSMIADKMSAVPAPVLQAIRSHQPIPDMKLAALFDVTTEMVKSLGQPSPAAVKAFLDAGYQERDLLYIVLAQKLGA